MQYKSLKKSLVGAALLLSCLGAQAATARATPRAPAAPSRNSDDPYAHIDPQTVVPAQALQNALAYWDQNKSRIPNQKFLTVIDYTQKSTRERFYLIDMRSGAVESLLAAHGKGSDSNHDGYATVFSNTSGSHATSLGFYLTAETYYGENGYSLRLDGLSATNSNARSRAIVVHGASYVDPDRDPIGRSWGCPVLENGERSRVINLIAGGSLIYSYHATKM